MDTVGEAASGPARSEEPLISSKGPYDPAQTLLPTVSEMALRSLDASYPNDPMPLDLFPGQQHSIRSLYLVLKSLAPVTVM